MPAPPPPPAPGRLRRVVIHGVTGSGKSTAAAAISAATGIAWHSVDDLMFEPGWRQVDQAEQRRRVEAVCMGDRWILDTACSAWQDLAWERAEVVVGLDYPRWRSLSRLLRRTARRASSGELVCNGNRETWRQVFSRESILLWHAQTFTERRRRIRAAAASPSGPRVLVFGSPRALEAWIATLRPDPSTRA